MLTHLILICHSTQEANVGSYAAYGLTEEKLARMVAQEQARLLNTIGPAVKAVLVNPIATDAGKAAQTVGDLMDKCDELYDSYRRTDPGVVVRILDTHTDAGGAYGTTGLYYSTAGKVWIGHVYGPVAAISPGSDHGLRRRTDLGILTGTKAVAGLIELGPHDRPESTRHLVEHPDLYAAACVKGMCSALGLDLPPEMRPTPEPVPVPEVTPEPAEPLAAILARVAADVAKAQALV